MQTANMQIMQTMSCFNYTNPLLWRRCAGINENCLFTVSILWVHDHPLSFLPRNRNSLMRNVGLTLV